MIVVKSVFFISSIWCLNISLLLAIDAIDLDKNGQIKILRDSIMKNTSGQVIALNLNDIDGILSDIQGEESALHESKDPISKDDKRSINIYVVVPSSQISPENYNKIINNENDVEVAKTNKLIETEPVNVLKTTKNNPGKILQQNLKNEDNKELKGKEPVQPQLPMIGGAGSILNALAAYGNPFGAFPAQYGYPSFNPQNTIPQNILRPITEDIDNYYSRMNDGSYDTYNLNNPESPNYQMQSALVPSKISSQPQYNNILGQYNNLRDPRFSEGPVNGRYQEKVRPLGYVGDLSKNYGNPDFSRDFRNSNQGRNSDYHRNRRPNENSNRFSDQQLNNLAQQLYDSEDRQFPLYADVNYGSKLQPYTSIDGAHYPLFQVNDNIYKLPIIKNLTSLYDNYNIETNIKENINPRRQLEEEAFLNSISSTLVMEHALNAINKQGIPTKNLLKTIWFNMFSRGNRTIGSSGFEHVFLTEIKNNLVSGFHNWIYFAQQESKKNANYLGYLKIVNLGNNQAILKYRMKFKNTKDTSKTMFIGTTPQFEMALYTICFVFRSNQDCNITLNNKNFKIKTYKFIVRGQELLSSAYPEI